MADPVPAPDKPAQQLPNDTRPIPDPTTLTNELVARAMQAEREWTEGQLDVLRQRLSGMDMATDLRITEIHELAKGDKAHNEVLHLKELHEERFASVQQQFTERDTRSERESRDNKVAVDAAFAAQKEAASEQNKSNTLAIDKSEKATAETLNKQADLFSSSLDGQAQQLSDLKERVSRIESVRVGSTEATANGRAIVASIIGIVLFLITLVGFVIAFTVKP